MKYCLRCGEEHDGSYGTGRYCCKKCAFTKNENQIRSVSGPKSEEVKIKMRKPKKDSSKMGKYDKSGSNNPNSISKNGYLKIELEISIKIYVYQIKKMDLVGVKRIELDILF